MRLVLMAIITNNRSARADFVWLWKSHGTDVPWPWWPCPSFVIGWEMLARYMIGLADFLIAGQNVPCAMIFHPHTKSAL
jgi:hypothetical protein